MTDKEQKDANEKFILDTLGKTAKDYIEHHCLVIARNARRMSDTSVQCTVDNTMFIISEYVKDIVDKVLQEKDELHKAEIARIKDRELLADLTHQIWCNWMQYQFKLASRMQMSAIFGLDNVSRWMRQMRTDYKDLSEDEKESDRHQADKIISFIDSTKNQPN